MRERLLTIYGVLICTFQATVSTIRQYYVQWQLERAIGKIMRAHDKRRRAIGKAILPVMRDLADKVNEKIEKGA